MVRVMQTRPKSGTSVPLYALGAIFLVPMVIGVVLVNASVRRNDHANQVSRDIASMYAQGLDFSARANQEIALSVAEGLGINMHGGKGAIILSRIRMVHASDCSSEPCPNKGFAVVTQRFVIGNAALRTSSFGTPASIDPVTGIVRNWITDASARAQDFPVTLKPGEFTYVAECYLTSSESPAGLYSRAMF